jgi:hypothetical protein
MVYRKAEGIAWLTINGAGGASLALQAPGIPELEDFAPGCTRWLRTCRITADLTATGIHGRLSADATQLLDAMSHASNRIDQRFSLYTDSILTGTEKQPECPIRSAIASSNRCSRRPVSTTPLMSTPHLICSLQGAAYGRIAPPIYLTTVEFDRLSITSHILVIFQ